MVFDHFDKNKFYLINDIAAPVDSHIILFYTDLSETTYLLRRSQIYFFD